jgi:hypothetical protein
MPTVLYTMIRTSYFARAAKEPGAVSIARFPPRWYAGARYLPLAPPPALLKIDDRDEYRRRYDAEVLSVLDPDMVIRDLETLCPGHDSILLCFERDPAHCHRRLVAAWLYDMRGIHIPELGQESATRLAV